MKRPLKSSEKLLLALCGGVMLLVAVGFTVRDHRTRKAAALAQIEELEPQLKAAQAAASDAPFWDERIAWLDATMPAIGDSGESHSRFLEHLQSTARQRGLAIASPVLLKPEASPHRRDLAITLQISGPDQALYRWLADIQSPEKFQLVKYLLLTPQPATAQAPHAPRMAGTVTVARLFKP
jgi:hypothetical protein